jgi:hypothetical protein
MNELSPEARALLRAARSFDEPNEEDNRRVRSAVFARVGVGVAAGVAATVSTSSLAASTGAILTGMVAKVGVTVLLVGGLSTGAYFAMRSPAPVHPVIQAPSPPQAPIPPPAPFVQSVSDVPKVEAQPVPVVRPAKEPVPVAAPSRPSRPARPNSDVEGEVRLLEGADADLRRGDASAALARLAEHASKYPDGALREEREGMSVVALCRAGRLSEGKAAAERFLSRAPKSPLASRMRVACGIQRPTE